MKISKLKKSLFLYIAFILASSLVFIGASIKISDMSEITSLVATDLFVTAQEDVSDKKITWANLRLQAPWITNFSRPQFSRVDTNTITIGPGAYYLYGKGWCYWTSDITFDFGSGGSNAGSSDLTASEYHHIAIDYSSASAAGVLVAANFINREASAVTPAYSGTKGGVYQDTDDRVIFSVRTNASSQVEEFYHDGGDSCAIKYITDASLLTPSTTPTDVTLTIPSFCGAADVVFYTGYSNAGANLSYRPNGATYPFIVNYVSSAITLAINHLKVMAVSCVIEVYFSNVCTNYVYVYTQGWYFPAGM